MEAEHGAAGEEGLALPLTLLALMIVTASCLVVVGVAVAQTVATDVNRAYVSALPMAEAGLELVKAQLATQPALVTTATGTPPLPTAPADQRSWALARFEEARTAGTLVAVPGGSALGLRPRDDQGKPAMTVLGVGESAGGRTRIRVVALDIEGWPGAGPTATPSPSATPSPTPSPSPTATPSPSPSPTPTGGSFTVNRAILTAGNLTMASNAVISSGGVHANGNFAAVLTTVVNPATASGTRTGCNGITCGPASGGSGVPAMTLPDIRARNYWDRFATTTAGWYDLCTGQVRLPAVTGPCTGTVTAPGGWAWTASSRTWTLGGNQILSGVYYAHEASIRVTGAVSGNAAFLASRAPGVATSGNITVAANLANAPLGPAYPTELRKVGLIADRDLLLDTNLAITCGGAGPVLLAAGEQISALGNASICAALLALDNQYWGGATNTAGSPVSSNRVEGNAVVSYDGSLGAIPFPTAVAPTPTPSPSPSPSPTPSPSPSPSPSPLPSPIPPASVSGYRNWREL